MKDVCIVGKTGQPILQERHVLDPENAAHADSSR